MRCVHFTIVPSDEALLALFEATSEELVRELYAHAGIPFERITGASGSIRRGDASSTSTQTQRLADESERSTMTSRCSLHWLLLPRYR